MGVLATGTSCDGRVRDRVFGDPDPEPAGEPRLFDKGEARTREGVRDSAKCAFACAVALAIAAANCSGGTNLSTECWNMAREVFVAIGPADAFGAVTKPLFEKRIRSSGAEGPSSSGSTST